MKNRLPVLAGALLALCLLCACAQRPAAAPDTSSAPSAAQASEETPGTEPSVPAEEPSAPAQEPSAPAEEPSAPAETEAPPRVFTDEDFHFYLGAQGAPEEGRINVAFYPDNRDASGAPDPDIRVWDSCRITNAQERRDICERILACELYDAGLYGRSLDSMLVEWAAHNDVNALYDNERTRHVDFNRADEGLSYEEFWKRAVREYLGR